MAEYVGPVRTPAGYAGYLRVATTMVLGNPSVLRLRLYTSTDSLVMSRVIRLENCTVFSTFAWTCSYEADTFTLDSNTLEWKPYESRPVVLRKALP